MLILGQEFHVEWLHIRKEPRTPMDRAIYNDDKFRIC